MPESKEHQGRPGIGVDSHGGNVIDPTENVKALSEASDKRQDDLRELNNRRLDANITRVDAELNSIRRTLSAQSRSTKEIIKLQAKHAKEMQVAEAKRIDAIRAVDVNAVAVASQRA
jgi:hypothetical protein